MAYDLYTGDSADEQARVAYLMQLFSHARLQRINFEVQWEESSALVWPELRNSFTFGHVRAPGVKYTQYQVDSAAAIKAWRFTSIADALVTPFNMMWARISTDNDYLLKQRAARLYFEQWTQALWDARYKPEANFHDQQQTNWQSIAVFGNQYMLVDALDTAPGGYQRGLRYMQCSVGEIYLLVNHQGRVDGFIRHFRWTARQAYQRWGNAIPPTLAAALEKADSFTMFDFLQFVIPNTEYDPQKIFSVKGKPWSSIYVSVPGHCILEEGGYRSFPLAVGRYSIAPEEWYGRGPTQQVLPALKTLNAEVETFLKQGLQAGDPTYLLPEDGLFDFKAVPGMYNYGGVNDQGQPLVHTLPAGNIQITQELMERSEKQADAAFLVDLFPLLFNNNNQQKSAREVIEVANQMGIFLAPTLGRQFGYIGDLIRREMVVLREIGRAPKMPPVVKEAMGDFKFIYTSPLGQALHGQEIAGYFRTVDLATQVANATGDPSVYDEFDFSTSFPEIAMYQHSPTRWMASAAQKAAKAKARAAQAARDQQSKELPGQAAIMKAQAITAKAQAGQNIGGTLSGTPQGGMPMVPSAPPGIPGQPGRNGQPGTVGQPAPGGG